MNPAVFQASGSTLGSPSDTKLSTTSTPPSGGGGGEQGSSLAVGRSHDGVGNAGAAPSHDHNGDYHNGNVTDGDDGSDIEERESGADGAKRPRLRLAHACDRCRKRKIRCDTQQPCGPCQATRNECTFHTPSRRVNKPKGSTENRSSSLSGIKRPHSPVGSSRIGALGPEGQANLEARLAALEAMLGDVPPKVHNAFLSSLDARLGSGGGVGINEGKGEGVRVALEALAGTSLGNRLNNFGADGASWGSGLGGLGGLGGAFGGMFSNRLGRGESDDVNDMTKKMEGMSFFYEDEIGQAKWQGATSGFPLLDLLTASNAHPEGEAEGGMATLAEDLGTSPELSNSLPRRSSSIAGTNGNQNGAAAISPYNNPSPPPRQKSQFFPDRHPRPHQTLNPEASWKVITGVIPPDLMDTLVRCYLSTSHLLWPFLHVPSFLHDYANPQQWGEPGFACFIVAVCTLSSRHVDDPRVRANPQDPSTAGKRYFELFKRLRDLPSADRPTLYSIQAAFLAAIYAFGLGNLSKAFSLLAESITLCLDGGLHRSVDSYDHFNLVEKETRKRTFWSIYSWDKQSAALFGRPPVIHLRDCDVTEPLIVDDEDLTPEGVQEKGGNPNTSRMCAFVAAIRLHVVLEGVIDSATQPSTFPTSPFLAKASNIIAKRAIQNESLREEEVLLEEWKGLLPKYWQYDTETTNSRDPIRITQAERLHCLEHMVKMLIYRHRFSGFVALRPNTPEEMTNLLDICRKAMQCALTIIADHVHISQRGMMTYYGVHVIHQLAQAGRTLVAVILNCRNGDFRPMIAPCIEGLRSCVGLLRRFSGRYLCGLRSADIIDEFCRICNIPVDSPRVPDGTGRPSPAWLRPVRRRPSPSPGRSRSSPSNIMDFGSNGADIMSNPAATGATATGSLGSLSASVPTSDLEALFNTSDYFDLSTMSPQAGLESLPNLSTSTDQAQNQHSNGLSGISTGLGSSTLTNFPGQGDVRFDYRLGSASFGVGGESLAGEGMDTVSDGLKGGDAGQGLSAATILSLLEEGSFDYGSVFTDQAS